MALALEHYVNNVRSLSASGSFCEFVEYLNDSMELLTKNWSILDNVLETLDVHQHSLGVLYILVAKLHNIMNSSVDPGNIIDLVKEFFILCNEEQVRYALQTYYELCHVFTNFLVRQSSSMKGIKILAQAVKKIRQFESQLTAAHADLYQLCLCAKLFKPALEFLKIGITGIATTEDSNHDTRYFLLNYYYGGMIHTALKDYDRALFYFEVAVSTPAMAMSHIMLESYKKFILVSLILHGKVSTIPKYSSQVISRFMKPLSQAYHDLANAYLRLSIEEMRVVVNKYREVYVRDDNMGLVKQVITSIYKKNIQRLTKTFLTLSLSDVASRVQLPSASKAEKYILNMIKSGEICATINQKDGMVVFKDDPEKYDSADMFVQIQQNVQRVMKLNQEINKMEEDIMLNPVYVKKAMGNQEEDLGTGQHTKSYAGDPMDL